MAFPCIVTITSATNNKEVPVARIAITAVATDEAKPLPKIPTCPSIKRPDGRLCLAVENPYIAVLTRLFELYDLKLEERAGVPNHGVSEVNINLLVRSQPFAQNVMEHAYMFAQTNIYNLDFFPEMGSVFPPNHIRIALNHDNGEKYLKDIPDDGRTSAEQQRIKDEFELRYFEAFMCGAPEWSQLRSVFMAFQSKLNILYLGDKFEFITFLAWTTMYGYPGSLAYKRELMGLTEQDEHNIALCGSERTIDVMIAHFVEHSVGIAGRNVYLGLIEQIFCMIDGRIPDWYLDLLKKNPN